jgi:hypothetical protein
MSAFVLVKIGYCFLLIHMVTAVPASSEVTFRDITFSPWHYGAADLLLLVNRNGPEGMLCKDSVATVFKHGVTHCDRHYLL